MRIILDSNVIIADPRLLGSAFRVLLEELNYSEDTLDLPRVVIDECVNKAGEDLEKQLSKRSAAQRQIQRLTGGEQALPTVEGSRFKEEYRTLLEAAVSQTGGEVLPYPTTTHIDLVRRALDRRRPFSDKGTGYRDALIWHTIIDVLDTGDDDVAFISLNSADFADGKGGLHPHLAQDLDNKGIDASKLGFYPSLQEFVDVEIKPTLELVQEALQAFKEANYPFDLQEGIALKLQEISAGVAWPAREIGAPEEYGSPVFDHVEQVYDIRVESVRRLRATELLVELNASIDVEFDVFINHWDLALLDEDEMPFISDWNWSDSVAEGSKVFTLNVGIDLTYSAETDNVLSMTLKSIEPRNGD